MRFWGTFRFELRYQLRRPWPWLAFVTLVVFAFFNTRVGILPVTLPQDDMTSRATSTIAIDPIAK